MNVENVVITPELSKRVPKPINLELENRILRDLGRQLTQPTEKLLKHFIKIAKEFCQGDTAGISLIQKKPSGEKILRWVALAGSYEKFEGGTIDLEQSPCGFCLNTGSTQLFSYPARYFTNLKEAQPEIVESIVVPLNLDGKTLGTIWVVQHEEGHQFDQEDARLLTNLAEFLAAALVNAQTRQAIEESSRLEKVARIASEKLHESEERFRTLVKASAHVLYRMSPDWKEMRSLQGGNFLVDTQKPTIDWLEKYINPEDQKYVLDAVDKAIQNKSLFELEHRVLRADGTWGWTRSRAVPLLDATGDIIEWFGEASDVTQRKRAEILLVEQKKLLELIAFGRPLEECLLSLCDSVSKLNPKTRAGILLANPSCSMFSSCVVSEFPPSFEQALKNAPIAEQAIGTCAEAVYHGKTVTCYDIANDERWSPFWQELCLQHGILACHSTPIRGLDDFPLGSLMLCFDQPRLPIDWEYQIADFGIYVASIVLERERSNLALRESEEKYRLLFNSMGEAFAVCDMIVDDKGKPIDFRFLDANPPHETATGLDLAKTIGSSARELIPDLEECWFEMYGRVAINGESLRIENYVAPLHRWFDIYAYKIGNMNDRRFAIIYTDITQRKQSEIQLRQQATELSQLNESLIQASELLAARNQELDSFTYVVSHDLKAPLRAIANLSQWLEEDLEGEIDDSNQHQLQLLRNRVVRMDAMIDGLLTYSRVGRAKLETELVDVGVLLEEILDSLAPPSSFTINIHSPLPTLMAKRLLLSQVLSNLISNGIKHHPRTDGKIDICVSFLENFYEFAISDDGEGIAPHHQERIFGIFQTINSRDVKESTGIGLSIVKKIVENEGGKIKVESELGSGATFRFTWLNQSVSHKS